MTDLPKPGDCIDVLQLHELRRTLHINVYLYMDEELARCSTLADDIETYRLVDPDFRPMMEIEEWFKAMQKQMRQIAGADVDVAQMFTEEPLSVEIFDSGEMQTAAGPRTYLRALLPYLDEMEDIDYSDATVPSR